MYNSLFSGHFNYFEKVGKKKIIKKYEQLTPELLKLIKQTYPDGYEESLITFQTIQGELALALPLETEEVSYLIRMPRTVKSDDDDEDDSENSDDNSGDFSGFENLDVAEDIADDE